MILNIFEKISKIFNLTKYRKVKFEKGIEFKITIETRLCGNSFNS
jgi:hypothetical protein